MQAMPPGAQGRRIQSVPRDSEQMLFVHEGPEPPRCLVQRGARAFMPRPRMHWYPAPKGVHVGVSWQPSHNPWHDACFLGVAQIDEYTEGDAEYSTTIPVSSPASPQLSSLTRVCSTRAALLDAAQRTCQPSACATGWRLTFEGQGGPLLGRSLDKADQPKLTGALRGMFCRWLL